MIKPPSGTNVDVLYRPEESDRLPIPFIALVNPASCRGCTEYWSIRVTKQLNQ